MILLFLAIVVAFAALENTNVNILLYGMKIAAYMSEVFRSSAP